MATLTERQQGIRDAFMDGKGAREIANELGISRNAVYQVLQRLRQLGAIDPDFNPTGQPVRETRRYQPGMDVLARITGRNGDDDELASAGALALAQELARVRDELDAVSRRISMIVPR